MTHGWEDSAGVLAAGPEQVEEMDTSLTGSAVARPARSGPWMVEGARSTVRGDELSPMGEATLPGGGRVTWSSEGLGRAVNLLVFPGVLRRDLVGPNGTAIETIVVAPTLPLVVREIRGSGAGAPFALTLTLPGSGVVVVTRSNSGLAVHRGECGIALTIHPPPASWQVDSEGDRDEVRVSIGPSGERCTLLLTGGTARESRAALAAGAHARGHALRAASGPAGEGVCLETGVPGIDDGFAWARHRLHGLEAGSESESLWLGLAAQAVGDRELANACFADEAGRGSISEALLAARFGSVFGDARRAARIAERWVDGTAEPHSGSGGPADAGLRALAAVALAEALQYGTDPTTLAALRGMGRPSTPRSSGRTLPMAGRTAAPASDHEVASWLRSVFAGEPTTPVAPGSRAVRSTRQAAADFRRDPDRAWSQWRSILDQGGDSGSNGVGIWPPGVAPEITIALLHGMLGLDFDAPVGRVRLAPALPSHLRTFAITGIPLGDASLRLEYEASGSVRRFSVAPVAGGVPPLVVFEPSVAGRVREVRVDGQAADLALRFMDGRTVAPVQFALDGRRTVEIVAD